jgi:hypothetical protein
MNTETFLLKLCDAVYKAEKRIQEENKRKMFGGQFIPELLLMRKDKVRVEIRKENVSHNAPHFHVKHSDKIDVSISLIDFSILAGDIDRKTYTYLLNIFFPQKDILRKIWKELNEEDNSIGAEKIISNLSI